MTATAVILAGGRGTRSADPTTPKLAQRVGGRLLMAWHLDLLAESQITRAIVVAGHLGDQVQALCDSLPHASVSVEVIHEAEQRGTVAALQLAADHVETEELLVILGDILMSFPVDAFLDRWRASGRGVAVAVHPSTHPYDSDAVFTGWDGQVRVIPKSAARPEIPNMSSTGLFGLTRDALSRVTTCRDIGSDVLPHAAESGDLYADVNSHYFKDTGTPDRLAAAERDVASGAFARRGSLQPRRAVFLDRDGVINPASPEVYNPMHFSLNPGVAAAIGEANLAGVPVLVATNQPGLAKGFMSFDTHEAIRARMDALLAEMGAFVDDYAACPHHPETGFPGEVPDLKVACECRKPAPGLIEDLAKRHEIDVRTSVMVGDTDRDAGAATAAGATFIRADAVSGMAPSDAIRQAVKVVTC